MPAGFVHNPQQELRRVEKARRPNIIRRGGGPKIRRTARRRSQSPLSPWLRAFWPTGTMLPVHSRLALATTCAGCSSSPECPHTGSEFGQQPSQPYTSLAHFKTPNSNENSQTLTNGECCRPFQEDLPHPRVYNIHAGSQFGQ